MSATLNEASTPQDAAAALAAAVQSDRSEDQGAPAPVVPVEPVAPAANQPPADAPAAPEAPAPEGTTPEAPEATDDSLLKAADINLEGLTPEARDWLSAREREMQAVMTKRTQEAAETVKQYEGISDPNEAREALAFYQGLRTDPNYAAEVYDFLTQNLVAAGYSPAKAAAKALETMSEPETPDAPAPAAFSDDPDEAISQRLAQLDEQQRKINARIADAEAREEQAKRVSQILQQDSAIRQANPKLTDEDMDYVYQLAEATQGDLFRAHETFTAMREANVRAYLASKEAVDSPVAPPAAPPAVLRETPKTLEDGYRMGLERLRNELATNS